MGTVVKDEKVSSLLIIQVLNTKWSERFQAKRKVKRFEVQIHLCMGMRHIRVILREMLEVGIRDIKHDHA